MIAYLSILSLLIDSIQLGNAVYSVSPGTYLTQKEAYSQAFEAIDAATPEIPSELLLGLAWVESRYYPTATSRVERGVRKTGIPSWRSPPKGTSSYFCGVTQVSAENSWNRCREFQNTATAYRVVVIELNRWLAPRVCNHNLRCALTGYNGGFPALKTGTRYASMVLWRARLIKQAFH